MSILNLFKNKKIQKPLKGGFCSMIIAAAGSSTRMGEDKQFLNIAGEPVILKSLKNAQACPLVNEIIVVTKEESIKEIYALINDNKIDKVSHIIKGGQTRTESVYKGISMVSLNAEYIAVHDGARPFATSELIKKAIEAAYTYKSAIVAVKVKDTIKETANNIVTKTLPRDNLWAVQTPQVFDAELLKAAYKIAINQNINSTDDSALIESMGMSVYILEGSYENIKITTKEDITIAEAIAAGRE